jgi:formylmethanofuran dehydrogenase subunit B
MVASSLLGAKICYGIVTTGAIWQFGKLDKNVFVIDPRYFSTTDLQRVFNTINWIFHKIS